RVPFAVLPCGSGSGRQGYPRHDPQSPVRQGRAGADRASGEVLRGARAAHRARRGDPEEARAALPRGDAVHRGYRVFCGEDLRYRGLAAVAEGVSRDLLVLQLRGVPGAPHAGAIPQRARQARAGAYPERLRPRRRAHPGRDSRELPERRRVRHRAWRLARVHERTGADRARLIKFALRSDRGEMPEWSNGADSKSVVPFGAPGVRIPLSPPYSPPMTGFLLALAAFSATLAGGLFALRFRAGMHFILAFTAGEPERKEPSGKGCAKRDRKSTRLNSSHL